MPYRITEHTADLGIEADGATPEEAMEWAALGLMEVVTGAKQPNASSRPDGETRFVVEATDLPALLVAFLSELLWLLESEDLLWRSGGVTIGKSQDGILRVEAAGNTCIHDAKRDGRGIEVKAVTYHAIRFAQAGDRWQARVILDI